MKPKTLSETYHIDLYIAKTLPPQVDRRIEEYREALTYRERETLTYMAEGYTSEELAACLFISAGTVITHRKNILKKLRVTNITAAVAYALRNQLIS
jgi:DNA-binding CsgD family transcriptional regulator